MNENGASLGAARNSKWILIFKYTKIYADERNDVIRYFGSRILRFIYTKIYIGDARARTVEKILL